MLNRGGFWLELGDLQVHFGAKDGIDRYATKSHVAYQVEDLDFCLNRLGEIGIQVLDSIGAQKVIGVDINEEMIDVAQKISNELKAKASWICCDILKTSKSLNEIADLIYTGRGAINWIHNLDQWAQTIARVLKPGGDLLHV